MKLSLNGKTVKECPIHANVHGIRLDTVMLDYSDFCELKSALSSNLLPWWIEGLMFRFVSTKTPGPIVFKNEKEAMKAAVRKEVENFCDMIDCVDEPPGLDYTVEAYGIKITISVELT